MRCQSPHEAALGERALPDRPTLCAAFADMKRHDSCSCHNRRPSSHKYFFAELFASIVAITFSAGYNKKELSTTSKEGFL